MAERRTIFQIQIITRGEETYLGPFDDQAEAHAYAAVEGLTGYTVEPVCAPLSEVEDSYIEM